MFDYIFLHRDESFQITSSVKESSKAMMNNTSSNGKNVLIQVLNSNDAEQYLYNMYGNVFINKGISIHFSPTVGR